MAIINFRIAYGFQISTQYSTVNGRYVGGGINPLYSTTSTPRANVGPRQGHTIHLQINTTHFVAFGGFDLCLVRN